MEGAQLAALGQQETTVTGPASAGKVLLKSALLLE